MYALLPADESAQRISLPNDIKFSKIQELVGGYVEMTPAVNSSRINAYVNEDGRALKLPYNRNASKIVGKELFGDVVLVGLYDAQAEKDQDLTDRQWDLIRSVITSHS